MRSKCGLRSRFLAFVSDLNGKEMICFPTAAFHYSKKKKCCDLNIPLLMPGFARNVHAFHCLWHFCAGGLFTCHCKGFLADANSWKRILRRTLCASVERKRAFHSHHQSTTDKKTRENIEDSDPARSFLRVGETIDPSLPPSFPGVHSTSAMEGRVKELDFDESHRGWQHFSLFILFNSLQLDAIDAFIRNPTPLLFVIFTSH